MDKNGASNSDAAVDELLATAGRLVELDRTRATVNVEVEMSTGVYDTSFFQRHRVAPSLPRPAVDHMEDARVGLGLFLDEANAALASKELTVDQRIHVATIVSYIEALANRFDRVRVPGFTQIKRSR
jgi:hypothetical protein